MLTIRPIAMATIIAILSAFLATAASAAPEPQVSGTAVDGAPSGPQEVRAGASLPQLLSFNVLGSTCTGPSCVFNTGEDLLFVLNHAGVVREYQWDWDGDGEADQVTTDPVVSHTRRATGTIVVTVKFVGAGADFVPINQARVRVQAVGTPGEAPAAVTNVEAVASERLAVATWEPSEGATGYRLMVMQNNGLEVTGPLLPATATTGFLRVGVDAQATAVRVRAINEMGEAISEVATVQAQPSWLRDGFESGLTSTWRPQGTGAVQATSNSIEGSRSLAFCTSGGPSYIEPAGNVPNGSVLDFRARLRFNALDWQPGDSFKFLELLDTSGRQASFLTATLLAPDRYRIQLVFRGKDGEFQHLDVSQEWSVGVFLRLFHALDEIGRLEVRLDGVTQDSPQAAIGAAAVSEIASFRIGVVDGLPVGADGCFIIDAVDVLSPNL